MYICRSGCPLPDNGGWFSRESEEMFEELYKSSLSPFLRSGCPLPDNGGWFSYESEEMFDELYKSSLSPFLPRRSSVTRNACVGEWRGNRGYILLINPLFIDNV